MPSPGIYTLPLRGALPILVDRSLSAGIQDRRADADAHELLARGARMMNVRSEEHTSELQSHHDIVCRLPVSTLFPYAALFRSWSLDRSALGFKLASPMLTLTNFWREARG